jgi:hypothetical protein
MNASNECCALPLDSVVQIASYLDSVADLIAWSSVAKRHRRALVADSNDALALWRETISRAFGSDALRAVAKKAGMRELVRHAAMLQEKRFVDSLSLGDSVRALVDRPSDEWLTMHVAKSSLGFRPSAVARLTGQLIANGCDRLLEQLLRAAQAKNIDAAVIFESADPGGKFEVTALRVAAARLMPRCAEVVFAHCDANLRRKLISAKQGWFRVPLQEAVARCTADQDAECIEVLLRQFALPWPLLHEVAQDEDGSNLIHLAQAPHVIDLLLDMSRFSLAAMEFDDDAGQDEMMALVKTTCVQQAVYGREHGHTPLSNACKRGEVAVGARTDRALSPMGSRRRDRSRCSNQHPVQRLSRNARNGAGDCTRQARQRSDRRQRRNCRAARVNTLKLNRDWVVFGVVT